MISQMRGSWRWTCQFSEGQSSSTQPIPRIYCSNRYRLSVDELSKEKFRRTRSGNEHRKNSSCDVRTRENRATGWYPSSTLICIESFLRCHRCYCGSDATGYFFGIRTSRYYCISAIVSLHGKVLIDIIRVCAITIFVSFDLRIYYYNNVAWHIVNNSFVPLRVNP